MESRKLPSDKQVRDESISLACFRIRKKKERTVLKNTTVKSRALLSFVSAQRVQTGYVIGASCVQFHFC